jgi:hypothetical protein
VEASVTVTINALSTITSVTAAAAKPNMCQYHYNLTANGVNRRWNNCNVVVWNWWNWN